MSSVLYRKYRPKSFDDIIGQDRIKNILLEQLKTNKIAHGYLFSGPRGTGKTTIARIFASQINQSDGEGSPDIIEIDAASNRGIDEIRDLKAKIDFVPSQGSYKIYVIDEVHMLTKEAFNALLKTLEEPPKHVIFILATTEPHKVPPTIMSRVMKFEFRLGTRENIKDNLLKVLELENRKLSDDALGLVVRHSRGSYRDSLTILEKIVSSSQNSQIDLDEVLEVLGLANFELVSEFIKNLHENQTYEALSILHSVEQDGKSVTQFIFEVLESIREKIFSTFGSNTGETGYVRIVRELYSAYKDAKYAPIESLPYEVAILNLAKEEISADTAHNTPMVSGSNKLIIPKTQDQKIETATELNRVNVKEVQNVQSSVPIVGIDGVVDQWLDLVERVKVFNHHLSAFVFKSRPVKIEDGALHIHVPYKIQKNRMESGKSSEIIRSEISAMWGIEKYFISIDPTMLAEFKKSVVEPDEPSNSELVEDVFKL